MSDIYWHVFESVHCETAFARGTLDFGTKFRTLSTFANLFHSLQTLYHFTELYYHFREIKFFFSCKSNYPKVLPSLLGF